MRHDSPRGNHWMREARVEMSRCLSWFLQRAICNLAGEPDKWRRYDWGANGPTRRPVDVRKWQVTHRQWDAESPLELSTERRIRWPDAWGGHLRKMRIRLLVYREDCALEASDTVAWLANGAKHTRPLSAARIVLQLTWRRWEQPSVWEQPIVQGVRLRVQWDLRPAFQSWRTCYAEVLRHVEEFVKVPPQPLGPFAHPPRAGERPSATEGDVRKQRLRAQWKAEDRARRALKQRAEKSKTATKLEKNQ